MTSDFSLSLLLYPKPVRMADEMELQDNAAYLKTTPTGRDAAQYPCYEEIIIGRGTSETKNERREPLYDEVVQETVMPTAKAEHQYEEPK